MHSYSLNKCIEAFSLSKAMRVMREKKMYYYFDYKFHLFYFPISFFLRREMKLHYRTKKGDTLYFTFHAISLTCSRLPPLQKPKKYDFNFLWCINNAIFSKFIYKLWYQKLLMHQKGLKKTKTFKAFWRERLKKNAQT